MALLYEDILKPLDVFSILLERKKQNGESNELLVFYVVRSIKLKGTFNLNITVRGQSFNWRTVVIQSTLSKADTLGTRFTVRLREVSALERVHLTRHRNIKTETSALLL